MKPSNRRTPGAHGAAALVLTGLLFSSCRTFYSDRADKEVYALIEKMQVPALGDEAVAPVAEGEDYSALFNIDTSFSDREPDDVTAQEILDARSVTETMTLNIDDAIGLAVAKSRGYQTQKEQLYLIALNYSGTRHLFRPQVFGTAAGAYTWLPNNITPAAADDGTVEITTTGDRSFDQRGTLLSSFGFDQMLLGGADLGLSITNDLLQFYTGDSRKSAVTTITANLVQPLLRGAGRLVAAEQLTQALRDVVYEIRDFSQFQDDFSAGIVTSYFRLLQQKDTVFNEYQNYESRLKSTDYLRERAVDREKPLDVQQAKQAELAAKSRYIGAVVTFRTSLDTFKDTVGIPQTTDLRLDDSELDRLRTAGIVPLHVRSEQGFEIALKNSLPLLNEIDRFEDSRRLVKVAADGLKPGLDIFADATVSSDGPVDYLTFDLRDLTSNVGIALDLPLNRRLERNAYRATLVSFEAQLRSLGETFDTLRSTIDLRIRELEQFRQDFFIQQNAVELAQTRVEGAQLNFQAGNAVFRDLEDAQDALIEAQNAVTAALVSHLETRIDFLTELGVLERGVEKYWLTEDASKVDLSTPPGTVLPDSFLRGDELIPPDELFSE